MNKTAQQAGATAVLTGIIATVLALVGLIPMPGSVFYLWLLTMTFSAGISFGSAAAWLVIRD